MVVAAVLMAAAQAQATLMDVAAIQVELQRLLGVSVDVLTPRALPDEFRNQVISEAVPV